MSWVSRLTNVFRSDRVNRDLDDELRFHVEARTAEFVRRGMTQEVAMRAAQAGLGAERVKEDCREAGVSQLLDTTLQDIRYGLRGPRKNSGFSLMAIATLALGIGVNTAIFSVVYSVLLRPLPYQNGGRLVVIHQQATSPDRPNIPLSVKEILDYRNQNHTRNAVVEHHSMFFLLLGPDWAERVQTAVVSVNFFEVLGVKPLLGRTHIDSDESRNADAALVLSYRYWQSRHGGDPNNVGKVFQMNNRPRKRRCSPDDGIPFGCTLLPKTTATSAGTTGGLNPSTSM